MDLFTTVQAANQLSITPRALRKFLRSSDRWSSAGFGGRYLLSPSDLKEVAMALGIPSPESDLQVWATDPEPIIEPEYLEVAMRNPGVREIVLEERRKRQARLQQRIDEVLTPRADNDLSTAARFR